MRLVSDQVSLREIQIILRELKRVLDVDVEGDIVELGCYIGTTSLFIADTLVKQRENRSFHVYDSFAGLPDKLSQDRSPVGGQFKIGELLATKAQFIKHFKQANLPLPIIHKGWFEDLGDRDMPEHIAFAFLDGDYYSSIRSSLRLIEHKLTKGSVIIVDDYSNEALPGARKAVDEWLRGRSLKLRVEASLAIINL